MQRRLITLLAGLLGNGPHLVARHGSQPGQIGGTVENDAAGKRRACKGCTHCSASSGAPTVAALIASAILFTVNVPKTRSKALPVSGFHLATTDSQPWRQSGTALNSRTHRSTCVSSKAVLMLATKESPS